jgi:hypothetical protein
MSTILCQIPCLFKNTPEDSYLYITKEIQGSYSASVEHGYSSEKIKSTWDCLKEIIGEDRMQKIPLKYYLGLDFSKIQKNTLCPTKTVVRNLFIGLMNIQKEDLVKYPNSAASSSIDNIYKQLLLFNNIAEVENALMGFQPKSLLMDRVKTSGDGLEGLIECVYIFMQHHFHVIQEQNQKAAELRDIEMLTSRFADREIRHDSVVHLSDGYFYVDTKVSGGGAYVYLLKDVEGKQIPKLVCRGTAMRRTATQGLMSGVNDVLIEIGTVGVKSVWPALSYHLREKKITSLNILGKSLGGAHAQELAILIEGTLGIKVEKLITNCSVGVGRHISTLFKKEILANRSTPLPIQVIRQGGKSLDQLDHIPAVGGVHLGEGTSPEKCDVEVCYIQPGDDEVGIYPVNNGWFGLIKSFFSSFSMSHCRQTTLQRFRWKKIENKEEINQHLGLGNKFETIRLCFAYAVHVLSIFLLNRSSFTSFFLSQKNNLKTS